MIERDDAIRFGVLSPDGTLTNERSIKSRDIAKCPYTIFMAEHYRDDGSCKCSNAEHRAKMIAEWEYEPRHFEGIPLRD